MARPPFDLADVPDLENNPEARDQIELCLQLGLPPSAWATIDPIDRALLTAYRAWQRDKAAHRCPGCGGDLRHTAEPHRFRVQGRVCLHCQQLAQVDEKTERKRGEQRWIELLPEEASHG